jgi:hypothetical protein
MERMNTHSKKVNSVVVGSIAYKNAFEPQMLSPSLAFLASLVSIVSVCLVASVLPWLPLQNCVLAGRRGQGQNCRLKRQALGACSGQSGDSMQEADANEDP